MTSPLPSSVLLVSACVLAGACSCESDVEQAQRVLDNAAAAGRPRPSAVGDVDYDGDPCEGSPGELVAVASDAPASMAAHGGTLYYALIVSSHVRSFGADEREVDVGAGRVARELDASGAGLFVIVQTDRGPARTHLVHYAPDGSSTRAMESDEVLLGSLLATDDGAYVLAGRVLEAPGPASQLLFFSAADGSSRVVFERDRGATALVRDEQSLYWLEYPHVGRGQTGASAIVRYELGGDAVEVVAESERRLSGLAIDGEHLHWVEREELGDTRGRLMRMPRSGGAPRVLHSPVGTEGVLAHRGLLLAYGGRHRLLAIDPAAGDSRLALEDVPVIPIMRRAVGDGALYWSTTPGAEDPMTSPVHCVRSIPLDELRHGGS